MPSISQYFGRVLLMEEQLKDKLRSQLPPALSVSEWIQNSQMEAEQLFDLVIQMVLAPYQEIEALGFEFAQTINDGKPVVQREGSAVDAAMAQLSNDAQLVIQRFLLEFENTVTRMLDSGMSPENVEAALQAGLNPQRMSPLWSGLIGGLGQAVASGVQFTSETAKNTALLETDGQPNAGDREWVWVTVEDSRVCVDCRPRHNQIETMLAWEQLGKPGSGWSICGDRCRCMLMPAKWAAENIPPDQPIKLDRAAVTAIGQRAKELAGKE